MSVSVKAFGLSHVGQVRERNEDTLCVEPGENLVIVADGMGGAPAGDVASRMAVQGVARALHAGMEMKAAIERANEEILALALADPALSGMGTTVTALHLLPDAGEFAVGHVGDSRAYRRRDGVVTQITRDHTLVRDMVEAGKLSPELERGHPFGHILSRALGTEDQAAVDLVRGPALPGDAFLLCTDGLMKVMEDEEIVGWLMELRDDALEETVQAMVDLGNQRGAPDNITLALAILK